jgi:hypothetical protein
MVGSRIAINLCGMHSDPLTLHPSFLWRESNPLRHGAGITTDRRESHCAYPFGRGPVEFLIGARVVVVRFCYPNSPSGFNFVAARYLTASLRLVVVRFVVTADW